MPLATTCDNSARSKLRQRQETGHLKVISRSRPSERQIQDCRAFSRLSGLEIRRKDRRPCFGPRQSMVRSPTSSQFCVDRDSMTSHSSSESLPDYRASIKLSGDPALPSFESGLSIISVGACPLCVGARPMHEKLMQRRNAGGACEERKSEFLRDLYAAA